MVAVSLGQSGAEGSVVSCPLLDTIFAAAKNPALSDLVGAVPTTGAPRRDALGQAGAQLGGDLGDSAGRRADALGHFRAHSLAFAVCQRTELASFGARDSTQLSAGRCSSSGLGRRSRGHARVRQRTSRAGPHLQRRSERRSAQQGKGACRPPLVCWRRATGDSECRSPSARKEPCAAAARVCPGPQGARGAVGDTWRGPAALDARNAGGGSRHRRGCGHARLRRESVCLHGAQRGLCPFFGLRGPGLRHH